LTQENDSTILILSYKKEILMEQFPVDDDLVETVWKLANPKPFENLTFSSALRRTLLRLAGNSHGETLPSSPSGNAIELGMTGPLPEPSRGELERLAARPRHKAQKANLKELVRVGLLHDGEELSLVNYQGTRVQQSKATISGGHLQFKGQHYSMSDLARELLKQVGFQSDSVRGPAHWVNANGVSVKDLWQKLLDKKSKK
jgi:hypothetical protein